MVTWWCLSFVLLPALVRGKVKVNCPCLEGYPTNGTTLWQAERTLRAQGSPLSVRNFSLRFQRDGRNCTAYAPSDDGGVLCYPESYGLGECHAHDLGLAPSCDGEHGDLPKWCSKRWCFVDPANCNVQRQQSHAFPLLDLHYSYVACGSEDFFTEDVAETSFRRTLTATPLRVVYGLEEPPYLYRDAAGKWTGVLFEFMKEVSEEVGFVMEEVPLSNESLSRYGQAAINTACANDVALGLADLCIANAWESAERVRLAQALPVWWQEQIHLVTFVKQKESAFQMLMKVFKPFHGELWAFIVGFVALYSALMWWVEMGSRNPRSTSTAGTCAYSCYVAALGYMSAAPVYMPKTVSGRLITTGFSFFILIIVASYTANLASFLLQDNMQGRVDSLHAAVDAGLRICTFSVLLPTLEAHIPGISSQIVFLDSYKQGFEDMGRTCDVQLIPPFAFDMAVGGVFTPNNPTAHCDKMLIGRPLGSINCIGLSSKAYHMPLSYFLVKHRAAGSMDKIKQRSEFRLPGSKCAAHGEVLETDQLYVSSMLGTITVAGILMLLGILVRCCGFCRRTRSQAGADRQRRDELSDDPSTRRPHLEELEELSPTGLSKARGRSLSFSSFVGSLASTATSRGGADLGPAKPPGVAAAAAGADLEVVRDAMAQVLALLSSRRGSGEAPPAAPGAGAADGAGPKPWLAQWSLASTSMESAGRSVLGCSTDGSATPATPSVV